MIGFSQTAGDARTFAAKHRYQVDIDQESVAQGLANTGAGLFQGMPVSTSLSASALNDRSGARTGLASLTSGVTVLLTLLVLAPLFSALPKPVLAALIIEAVVIGHDQHPRDAAPRARPAVRLLGGDRRDRRHSGVRRAGGRDDRHRPVTPLAHRGRHSSDIATLARKAHTDVFRDVSEHPGDEQIPGVVVIRMDGGLFFATSDALEDRLREIIHSTPDLTGVVLDCAGINFIDPRARRR